MSEGGGGLSGCACSLPPASLKGNSIFSFWPQDSSDSLQGRRWSTSACAGDQCFTSGMVKVINTSRFGGLNHSAWEPYTAPTVAARLQPRPNSKLGLKWGSIMHQMKGLAKRSILFAGYLEPFQRAAKVIKDKSLDCFTQSNLTDPDNVPPEFTTADILKYGWRLNLDL